MKISFNQYLLIGVFGVFILWGLTKKLLQYDLFPYKGQDKFVLFLTRNASQEGHVYGPRTFTLWNLSHVLYYALGAYLFPDKAFLLWCLGIVWEILEIPFNSSNLLDILWNSIGILIGLQLRK
jgi:hypothetical protein